jgi:hypothetical protein
MGIEWDKMSVDEKQSFVRDSIEKHHERRYLDVLESVGRSGPTWADLTEEQRENIRQENRRYDREMQEFGESLRNK